MLTMMSAWASMWMLLGKEQRGGSVNLDAVNFDATTFVPYLDASKLMLEHLSASASVNPP